MKKKDTAAASARRLDWRYQGRSGVAGRNCGRGGAATRGGAGQFFGISERKNRRSRPSRSSPWPFRSPSNRDRWLSFMGGHYSLVLQPFGQTLARTAEAHVNCGSSDAQQFSNFVGVIVQRVPESQYLAVGLRQ